MGNINITLNVSKELKKEMDKYPRANWSEVVIRAIKERLEMLKKI